MQIEDFMKSLQLRTTSAETLRAYRADLEKYQQFLRSRGLRANQATVETIEDFILYLACMPTRTRGEQLSPASVGRRLSVLSSYYEFLRVRSNGRTRNPVVLFKRPKIDNEEFRALDDQTVERLLQEITDVRDKAIIWVFLTSGLRLSELSQLDIDTIQQRRRKLPGGCTRTIGVGEVVGKGQKRRAFLIDEDTLNAVVAYLKVRGKDDNRALFLSKRHRRLSCRSIQDILSRWCRRLNLTHAHVHQLRHTFATRMANAGMSALVLQELLGHSSFTTTRRYFRIRPERLAREYFSSMEFSRGPDR